MSKDSLCCTCAPVIGRILLSAIFIMSGVNKIMNELGRDGGEDGQRMIHFMKNLSIMGGLFIVLGLGAGRVC